jgi:hypothetical protein
MREVAAALSGEPPCLPLHCIALHSGVLY